MGRRPRPRWPLLDVVLAGRRATWHAALRWAIAGLALVTALLVAIEPHRVCAGWGRCDPDDWGPWHTLAADQGALPFALLALILALQLGAYRRRMLASLLTAFGSLVVGCFLFLSSAMTHFLSNVEGGGSTGLCAFAVTLLALAQLVLEPVLVVDQRRWLEATAPVVPRAVVVTR